MPEAEKYKLMNVVFSATHIENWQTEIQTAVEAAEAGGKKENKTTTGND